MPNVTLDAIAGVSIGHNNFVNEQRTLQMLSTGLVGIARHIKQRELAWQAKFSAKLKIQLYGLDVDGTKDNLDQVACLFHWFGVSLCNYARLVGFVRGLSMNDFTRTDLSDPTKFKTVKESVDGYINAIPDLYDVVVWRNKVGAHFAITAPHKSDNIATLDMSIMFPVTFSNSQYRVGEWTLTRNNSSGSHSSAIPCWSVTEVFENLIPRYWPKISIATSEEAN
jgi:hypothetical protein